MRDKPKTRYQRESAVCEILRAIKRLADTGTPPDGPMISELSYAGEILLSLGGSLSNALWEKMDRMIDKANGVKYETIGARHIRQYEERRRAERSRYQNTENETCKTD